MMAGTGARETLEGAEALIVVLLRNRRQILRVPVIVVFFLCVLLLLLPRKYSAEVVVLPRSDSGVSAVAGLAAQFGIAIPGGTPASPRVFSEVLTSTQTLRAVVLHQYDVPEPRFLREPSLRSESLVGFFELVDEPEEEGIQKAMEKLRESMSVEVDDISGTVTLRVTTKWPALSYGVTRELIAALERFNQISRRSQAQSERIFVQARLDEAMLALRATEDSLQSFLLRNRQFRDSPVLTFEFERLQRTVGLRQQVAVSLSQAYEQAQIAEVRDTPVITVVNDPIEPARPDRRRLLFKAIGLYIVVLAVTIMVAFIAEVLRLAGGARREPGELSRLVADAQAEVKQAMRTVFRRR